MKCNAMQPNTDCAMPTFHIPPLSFLECCRSWARPRPHRHIPPSPRGRFCAALPTAHKIAQPRTGFQQKHPSVEQAASAASPPAYTETVSAVHHAPNPASLATVAPAYSSSQEGDTVATVVPASSAPHAESQTRQVRLNNLFVYR